MTGFEEVHINIREIEPLADKINCLLARQQTLAHLISYLRLIDPDLHEENCIDKLTDVLHEIYVYKDHVKKKGLLLVCDDEVCDTCKRRRFQYDLKRGKGGAVDHRQLEEMPDLK